VRRITAVRAGKIIARAIQVLFAAPPAIAGVVSLFSFEISNAIIYLVEAMLLLVVIEAGIRFAAKAWNSPRSKTDHGPESGGPGYYLDEIDAAQGGAFFRGGEISENRGGPGFYT
jgi:hypothetical protein